MRVFGRDGKRIKKAKNIKELEFIPSHDFKRGECSCSFIDGEWFLTEPRKNQQGSLFYLNEVVFGRYDFYNNRSPRDICVFYNSEDIFWGAVQRIGREDATKPCFWLQPNTFLRLKQKSFVDSWDNKKYDEDNKETIYINKKTKEHLDYIYIYLDSDCNCFVDTPGRFVKIMQRQFCEETILEMLKIDEELFLSYFSDLYFQALGKGFEFLESFEHPIIQETVERVRKITIVLEEDFAQKGNLSIATQEGGGLSSPENLRGGELSFTRNQKKIRSKKYILSYFFQNLPGFLSQMGTLAFSFYNLIAQNYFFTLCGLVAFVVLTLKYEWQSLSLFKDSKVLSSVEDVSSGNVKSEEENLSLAKG